MQPPGLGHALFQKRVEQTQLYERIHHLGRAGEKDLFHLVPHALRRERGGERGFFLYCGESFFLDREAEPRGESQRAEHAQRVLLKAQLRIADAADDPVLYVVHAAEGVGDQPVGREGDGVHREVAAAEVGRKIADEAHRGRVPVVGIGSVAAEGSDLDGAGIDVYGHGAVLQPRRAGVRKNFQRLLRQGTGADIPVLRMHAEDHVAHAAAYEIRRMAARLERYKDMLYIFGRAYVRHIHTPRMIFTEI